VLKIHRIAVRPIADRTGRRSQLGRQIRRDHQHTDYEQHRGPNGTKEAAVESNGEAKEGDEQPDCDKRHSQSRRQGHRPQPMLRQRRAENDWHKREHAGRQYRQEAREKR
jgi:hypothetical protein